MKALFVGYGSIAGRHIANLRSIVRSRAEDLVIDLLRSHDSALPSGIRAVHTSVESLDSTYDAVFITNPTAFHFDTLCALRGYSKAYFVEKPVFERTDHDVSAFSVTDGALYYVACPLRYTRVIQWVAQNVDPVSVRSIRATSSSYLPDWRPGVDYRNVYSAHTNLGGGVHIDLIHEWDYITHIFGFPDRVDSLIAKRSRLDIDSADIALYIGDYGDKTVEVHLDYFGRAPRRTLELIADEETIVCDLIGGSVRFECSGAAFDLSEERDVYQGRELAHFLDLVASGGPSDSDINHAIRVLRLAQGKDL